MKGLRADYKFSLKKFAGSEKIHTFALSKVTHLFRIINGDLV